MKKLFFCLGFFLLSFFFVHSVSAAQFTVSDAQSLQPTVDKAKDGDTIIIAGKLSGAVFNPYEGRFGIQSCFVDLKGKSLTLKGGTLFGQGHETTDTHKPGDEKDPYYHRAGICTDGGSITLDGIHIKEFEGGAALIMNAKVILKNSTIDGNDHGGIYLVNSSILAVNNNFAATQIALMPNANSILKVINNTFYTKSVVMDSCNSDPADITFKNNIVADLENIGGYPGPCPEQVAKMDKTKFSHDLYWFNTEVPRDCYNNEFCQDFPGRLVGNPDFDVCIEPGGLCGGSLEPRANAAGNGDPSIPGPNILGATGGPCTNPGQSICSQFIAANQPPVPPAEEEPPGPGPNPGPNPEPNPGPDNTNQSQLFPQIINPYNLPELFGNLLDLPKTLLLPSDKTTKAVPPETGMDLVMFVAFSAVYIMFIHFAVGIKSEFGIYGITAYFVLGGIIGWWFHTYEAGFVFSIILSLIFF